MMSYPNLKRESKALILTVKFNVQVFILEF